MLCSLLKRLPNQFSISGHLDLQDCPASAAHIDRSSVGGKIMQDSVGDNSAFHLDDDLDDFDILDPVADAYDAYDDEGDEDT